MEIFSRKRTIRHPRNRVTISCPGWRSLVEQEVKSERCSFVITLSNIKLLISLRWLTNVSVDRARDAVGRLEVELGKHVLLVNTNKQARIRIDRTCCPTGSAKKRDANPSTQTEKRKSPKATVLAFRSSVTVLGSNAELVLASCNIGCRASRETKMPGSFGRTLFFTIKDSQKDHARDQSERVHGGALNEVAPAAYLASVISL